MASVRELFATVGMETDTGSFIKAELAVEAVKKGLELIGEVAKEAVKGFAELILHTGEQAHELEVLADRTGIQADALQRLGFGAKLSGVSMDELAIGLNHLAKKGITDVEGGLASLADRIKEMPDDGSRAALAIEYLGRAGARMVHFLKGGSAEIKRLGEMADALGLVLNKDQLEQGSEFAQTWDAISMAFGAAGKQLAFQFIPDLLEISKGVLTWIAGNKKLIAQKVRDFALGIAHGIETAWTAMKNLWSLMEPFRKLLVAITTSSWFLIAALVVMAGYIASSVGAAILGLIASLAELTLAELAAAAIPILVGAAFLALAAVIALVAEDIYTFFQGGDSVTGDLVLILTEDLPNAFWDLVAVVGNALGQIWQGIKNVASAIWHALTDPITYAVDFWMKTIGGLIGWVINKMLGIGNAITGGLISGVKAVAGLIPGGTAVVNGLFGGGASPAASVAQSPAGSSPAVVSAPQFNAGGITVNATPGMDERAVADLTAQKFEDWLNTKNREAFSAVGGGT